MSISEFVVLLLVYSGLLIFFLIPFSKTEQSKFHRDQTSFFSIFRDNFVEMLCHKKAVLALVLFGFVLNAIQSGVASTEWHYNAHSGYSAISYKLTALYIMGSVVIYTVIVLLVLGYMRTIKSLKDVK